MADLDLATALQMFNEGTNKLALTRALSGATDQVNQIKASELDDQEKRAQLQGISNNLVMNMAALGTPATTMQLVQGAVGPKQYANANAMNMDALLTGNQNLGAEAQKQSDFENNPKYMIAAMKAQLKNDPVKKAQFDALQDERFRKHIANLDKVVDTQSTRFGNISKLQGVNNRIQDAMTMLEDPNTISRLGIQETARVFDSILSQGGATIQGTHDVTPETLKQWMAKSREFITSKPSSISMPEFIDFYKQRLSKIQGVNEGIIRGAQKNLIESRGQTFHEMNPDQFRMYVENKIPGMTVTVDPKTKKIKVVPVSSSGATPAPASAPVMKEVMVKDKNTGQMIKALQDEQGNIYSAE